MGSKDFQKCSDVQKSEKHPISSGSLILVSVVSESIRLSHVFAVRA